MTTQKLKKQDEEAGGVNPFVAAVAGAVVGAGVAVAGVALADEKNRKKINVAVTDAKELTMEYMANIQKQAQEKKNEIEGKLIADKAKVKMVVDAAKKSLHQAAKDVNKAVRTV